MLYEILRPVPGINAKVGDVVDGSHWTNARLLQRQLYIAPAIEAMANQAQHQQRQKERR